MRSTLNLEVHAFGFPEAAAGSKERFARPRFFDGQYGGVLFQRFSGIKYQS